MASEDPTLAEQTEADSRALLARGGLALTRIVPLEDGQSVIEPRLI